jgi:hypothetical protein
MESVSTGSWRGLKKICESKSMWSCLLFGDIVRRRCIWGICYPCFGTALQSVLQGSKQTLALEDGTETIVLFLLWRTQRNSVLLFLRCSELYAKGMYNQRYDKIFFCSFWPLHALLHKNDDPNLRNVYWCDTLCVFIGVGGNRPKKVE